MNKTAPVPFETRLESLGLSPIMIAHRLANPSSRATRPIAYLRNGAIVRQKHCVLCGEAGPSWNGNYRQTKTAINWEMHHSCATMDRVMRQGLPTPPPMPQEEREDHHGTWWAGRPGNKEE